MNTCQTKAWIFFIFGIHIYIPEFELYIVHHIMLKNNLWTLRILFLAAP
jgi:hypothetical protein